MSVMKLIDKTRYCESVQFLMSSFSKTEVFEYGDVINYILLTLRMLCEGCCRFYIV